MTTNDDDIITHFDAMRRVDQLATPPLDTLIARRQPQRARSMLLRATIATAAAAAITAISVRYETSHRPRTQPIEPSILAWRSPTASLLRITPLPSAK